LWCNNDTTSSTTSISSPTTMFIWISTLSTTATRGINHPNILRHVNLMH
jgi:hypothetical protein